MPTRFAINRNRILFGAAALFLIWLGGSLALHFGQKYHDRLDYDIDQQFPPDKPFVPGEIYASTLAAIMDHELHTGFGWRPNDFWFCGAPRSALTTTPIASSASSWPCARPCASSRIT